MLKYCENKNINISYINFIAKKKFYRYNDNIEFVQYYFKFKDFDMKKILIVLGFSTIFAFANESQIQVAQIPTGCIETKLSEATSILSCPSAEYKATFNISYGKRAISDKVMIEKMSEVKPIIIQQIK